MNFKGIILTVVSFLLVAVSCSVEDDAYMNNNNNNVENATVVSDQEAYLSFNVDAQAATKSISEVSPSDTLSAVTSCSVVLFSNNNILAVMDGVIVKNGELQNCSFLTKVRNDLKVAIIANTTQSFENCPTMKEVRETIQSANDLKSLVKYGEAAVSFDNVKGSASTKDAPTVHVKVTLHQLAAIVELASFNTTFEADAKVEEVVITKVELKNANVNTFTNQNGYSKFETLTKTMGMNVNNFSKVDFRTYESNDVTLSITFKVGEREYEKNYKINGGSVNSGYIYRLNVNMTLKTHDVDMNVELSVADWTNNSISMDMTEE